jgi:hypothetical protein
MSVTDQELLEQAAGLIAGTAQRPREADATPEKE